MSSIQRQELILKKMKERGIEVGSGVPNKKYDNIWIIGGSKVYNEFLNYNNEIVNEIVNEIYITYIDTEFKCDTFFTEIDNNKFRIITK